MGHRRNSMSEKTPFFDYPGKIEMVEKLDWDAMCRPGGIIHVKLVEAPFLEFDHQ